MTDIEAKKAFNLLIDYCMSRYCTDCALHTDTGCVIDFHGEPFDILDDAISHPIDNPINHLMDK